MRGKRRERSGTMAQNPSSDRRRFERISFDHSASVIAGDRRYVCALKDICFRGALLAPVDDLVPSQGQPLSLILHLSDSGELRITMSGAAIRIGEQGVAMRFDEIDIDSMTLLRRLVELNLGDPALLDRQLDAVIDAA